MSLNRLKVLLIGLGKQAVEDHLPAIEKSTDVILIGVVETNKEKLNLFLQNHPGVIGSNTLDFFISNPETKPDFVIISTPHNFHFEITKKALENGIHVLKEKPFAISLEEAKKLKLLAKENNVFISITLQRRFNPIYSTFFQLVDKIGEVFYFESEYTFFTDHPHDGWRGKRELAGGGCLIDMGYHMIDLLIWYFGLPKKIFAEMSFSAKEGEKYDAEDTARIVLRYPNKSLWGSLLVSRVMWPKREYLYVYGTRGSIRLERGKIERYSSNGDLQESLQREQSWPSAAYDQLEYFIKVIRREKTNINGPEQHVNYLALIESAYKSSAKGKYINITH